MYVQVVCKLYMGKLWGSKLYIGKLYVGKLCCMYGSCV